MHLFSLDWQPPFTSSEYQSSARALRKLVDRGLVERTSAGLYRIPQPEEEQYVWRGFEPDQRLLEAKRQREDIQKRWELSQARLNS